MSRYEDLLASQIRAHGLPEPERQHRFAKELGRDYRLDFAWPERRLAAEVDGGRFVGRATKGFVDARKMPTPYHNTDQDYRKRNLLQLLGWTLLAFPAEMVTSGEAINELALGLERDPLAPLPKNPVWDSRLRRHVASTLERDRQARLVSERKGRSRLQRQKFQAQLAKEQAERAARRAAAEAPPPDVPSDVLRRE